VLRNISYFLRIVIIHCILYNLIVLILNRQLLEIGRIVTGTSSIAPFISSREQVFDELYRVRKI